MSQKIRQENFCTISSLGAWMTMFSTNPFLLFSNISSVILLLHNFVSKCSNTCILYTTDASKALLSKNWFYFFFLIF